MSNNKFAKLANYNRDKQNLSDNRTNQAQKLKNAISLLVQELNIKNGSFKIYVHDGRPGMRIEIQNKVITDI
jgi:DNA repair ATPase RecN